MQSVIELCILLGWDGEGGESEKKKNAVSFVYFIHLIWHLLVI